MKIKTNIQSMYQTLSWRKTCWFLVERRRRKNTMFLRTILIRLCMIIPYILEEKWCLVRHLNPANHHLTGITKTAKDFTKRLDLKDIKLPINVRDTHKIEKQYYVVINFFGYENKQKHPIYVSKRFCGEKHVDLLFKWEVQKSTMFLWEILIRSCMVIHYMVEEKWCFVGSLNPSNHHVT